MRRDKLMSNFHPMKINLIYKKYFLDHVSYCSCNNTLTSRNKISWTQQGTKILY